VVERQVRLVQTFADAAAVSRARDFVELAGEAIVAHGRFTVTSLVNIIAVLGPPREAEQRNQECG
jgi:hypothetical protein